MKPETAQTPTTTPNRALIFHGYGATPADHWFEWLATRFEAEGVPTSIPTLPNPLHPDASLWEAAVGSALGVPDAGTVVVAHSLGCLTVLRYLDSLTEPWRLNALALVSGFTDPLPALPELDAFIGDGCDVSELRKHVDRMVVLRSDNDSLVPPALTDRLAARLDVAAQVVPGAGHFLADEGATSLPQVRDAVLAGVGSAVAGTQLGLNPRDGAGSAFGALMAQQTGWRATFGSRL